MEPKTAGTPDAGQTPPAPRAPRPRARGLNMVSGPLFPGVFAFALPVILTGLLSLFYNAADLIVLSNFAENGETALPAVGCTGSLINLLIGLFLGLSIGSSVTIAIALGARDDKEASALTHTAIAVSALLGVLVGTVGFVFALTFLRWMNCSETLIDDASLYLRIYFCGTPANMVYNFGAAILRTSGDTRRPLFILGGAGLVNVGLNLLFVLGLSMSVDGVAIATITSQYLSAAAALFFLTRLNNACRLDFKKIALHKNQLLRILRHGVPAGIQSSLFSFSNVMIQSTINSFGDVVIAASTASANLEGFGWTAINAPDAASMAFVGQNYGAKNSRRIGRAVLVCLLYVMIFWLAIDGAILLFREPLVKLYLPDSPDAVQVAFSRLTIVVGTYFLCGFMGVLSSAIRGMGASLLPTAVAIGGICGLRILWIAFVVPLSPSLRTLMISYPVSWGITLAVDLVIFLVLFRRRKREIERSSPPV